MKFNHGDGEDPFTQSAIQSASRNAFENPSSSARGLVMVIEDDEGIQAALGQALIEEGYEVVTADNGRHALDQLRSGPLPALILLDLMMPVMDGRAFLEVRATDPRLADVPVVIITADTRATHDASSLDAQAILAKPLSLQTLLETVAAHCTARRDR